MLDAIKNELNVLRKIKPVVLNITNYVTMDLMANVLLALGAAPIMSVYDDELEELIQIASAINVNIGTLDDAFMKRCCNAMKIATIHHKPIILDPVGAGASRIRTEFVQTLLKEVTIVRGNASEIIALQGKEEKTCGVEAMHSTQQAKQSAKELALEYDCIVVVSGVVDLITDGKEEREIPHGNHLMSQVTGMGCALTAVIAAFSAIQTDDFRSSILSTTYFGLCGMVAGNNAAHPGAFRTAFIDAIHEANFENMEKEDAQRSKCYL